MTQHNNQDGLESFETPRGISRRTVAKAAAWSVPVLAVAVATPLAAASAPINVGDFHADGTCGLLGVLNAGFTVTAGSTALPIGTVISITRTAGVADVSLLTWDGVLADVNLIDAGHAVITLSAPIPANTTLHFQNLVNVAVLLDGTVTVTLPPGYVAGGGAKPLGTLSNLVAVLCSAG